MLCCVGCHSSYDGESTVPPLPWVTKDENLKNERIRFVDRKDWQHTTYQPKANFLLVTDY